MVDCPECGTTHEFHLDCRWSQTPGGAVLTPHVSGGWVMPQGPWDEMRQGIKPDMPRAGAQKPADGFWGS